MFEGLSVYLTDLSRSYQQDQIEISRLAVSNTRDLVLEEDNSSSLEKTVSLYNHGVGTSSHQPTIELVSLFIDLSGLVREKSQFTQYINYCYRVSKESKPVLLEVLSDKQP